MIRPSLSLIWKEYREQRWFLLAALAIFLGFPLIEAAARFNNAPGMRTMLQPEFYSDSAVGLVLGFGGLLAIFVGVGSTTRDLRDELHVFWRSRPIGVGAWLGVKYAVGLLTVLTACTLPLLMQFWMIYRYPQAHHSGTEVGTTLGIHSFTLVLLFSIAFLIGCLVRHATQAALLALAAALMVYFLPVVVGPMSSLSAFNLMHRETFQLTRNFAPGTPAWWWFKVPLPGFWAVVVQREWATFAAAMLVGSAAAAALAVVAVRRDWRIEADRKAMHWSLGGVAVLLFGVTAFQVGSNLKVQRQFDFPVKEHTASGMVTDGRRGVMLLRDTSTVQWYGQVRVKLCSFELTDGAGAVSAARFGAVLAPPHKINVPLSFNGAILFWRPERSDRAHLLVENSGHVLTDGRGGSNYKVESLELVTFDLAATSAEAAVVHRLDLRPLLPDMQMAARAHQMGDRVFIAGRENVLVVDLSNADAPRVERSLDMMVAGPGNVKVNSLWVGALESTDAQGRSLLTMPLPPLPGLTPRERLAALLPLAMTNTRYGFDGDTLAAADRETGVAAYRLTAIDEQSARFDQLGRREYTPLERLTGNYTYSLLLRENMLYAHQMRLSGGVTVYDLRDPARPRSAGHFGVAKATDFKVAPLADGRLLMAADRLYVLEPPKRLE
jgi:hypothetical protein